MTSKICFFSSKKMKMGTDAKYFLQSHQIPQLFEALMTGLIYYRPEDPLDYIEKCIGQIRKANPRSQISWDMLIKDFSNGGGESEECFSMFRVHSLALPG